MRSSARCSVLFAAFVAGVAQASSARAQMFVHVPAMSVSAAALPSFVTLDGVHHGLVRARLDFSLSAFDWRSSTPGPRAAATAARRAPLQNITAPQRLFGGVEVPVGETVHAQKWRSVLMERATEFFEAACDGPRAVCDAPARAVIAAAVAKASSESPRFAIRRVNEAVNGALRFADDLDQYGVRDHWATASESLRSGRGDCEDYAILKFWALSALGVPADAMRLIIVRDVRRRIDHAVLAVAHDGENLILDSLAGDVRSDEALRYYEPRISFGADGSWLHGRQQPQVALAASR